MAAGGRIHFNMGTFAHNGDPCCDASNWDVKAPCPLHSPHAPPLPSC